MKHRCGLDGWKQRGSGADGGGGGLEPGHTGPSDAAEPGPLQSTSTDTSVLLENTYFFCSFLFFSAGPPRVPTPKASFGELSDSGVTAAKRTTSGNSKSSKPC